MDHEITQTLGVKFRIYCTCNWLLLPYELWLPTPQLFLPPKFCWPYNVSVVCRLWMDWKRLELIMTSRPLISQTLTLCRSCCCACIYTITCHITCPRPVCTLRAVCMCPLSDRYTTIWTITETHLFTCLRWIDQSLTINIHSNEPLVWLREYLIHIYPH